MRHLIFILLVTVTSCVTQRANDEAYIEINTGGATEGNNILVEFIKGPAHNHPSMAIWAEDLEGNYLETLFVTQYVATGKYGHGETAPNRWSNKPGLARRPASLPYWAHKRSIKAPDGLFIPSPETSVPDALTSATPRGNFRLKTSVDGTLSGKFRILLEINQPWDSNNFWTNSRFPDDPDYATSLQPSLVYAAMVDFSDFEEPVFLNPIGHGHPSGSSGKLYTDLTTITSAKEIIQSVSIRKIIK